MTVAVWFHRCKRSEAAASSIQRSSLGGKTNLRSEKIWWANKQERFVDPKLSHEAGVRIYFLFSAAAVALIRLSHRRAARNSYTRFSLCDMFGRGIAAGIFSRLRLIIFVVLSTQSPCSPCTPTQGRTRPCTHESSGHVTGAQTANILRHPVGIRR